MHTIKKVKISLEKTDLFITDRKMNSSRALSELLRIIWTPDIEIVESFYVVFLNRGNNLIGYQEISKGGITGTVADPRIILAGAINTLATNIVLAHNHPSGTLSPSRADETLTQKIKQAAALMDIICLDHIILTHDSYLSFADQGIL